MEPDLNQLDLDDLTRDNPHDRPTPYPTQPYTHDKYYQDIQFNNHNDTSYLPEIIGFTYQVVILLIMGLLLPILIEKIGYRLSKYSSKHPRLHLILIAIHSLIVKTGSRILSKFIKKRYNVDVDIDRETRDVISDSIYNRSSKKGQDNIPSLDDMDLDIKEVKRR